MTDREFVEQHWETPGVYRARPMLPKCWNVINMFPGTQVLASYIAGTKAAAWTAAAQFTRDRLEEIRQIEEELRLVEYQVWNASEIGNTTTYDDTARLCTKAIHRWSRIKARLEAQLAELKRGMKEPA